MVLSRHRLGLALAAACAGVTTLGGYHWWQLSQFNAALEQENLVAAARHASDHGHFAEAYRLEQQGEFQTALEQYGTLLSSESGSVATQARYNMATLTLREGMRLWGLGDAELAIPLVELAKTGFRELLQNTPEHWDARYNLEVALRLLPDAVAEPELEEVNPERSPRATLTMEAQTELP